MLGHSRPKDGVASFAYVPGFHVSARHAVSKKAARRHAPLSISLFHVAWRSDLKVA
jgi:hypothetical protein